MMVYEYDYGIYYRQNCTVPLSLGLFAVFLLIVGIIQVSKGHKTYTFTDWLCVLSIMGIGLFLLALDIIPLARGGIYLLREDASDGVRIVGTVEETVELSPYTPGKYHTENNNGHGEAIVVNGTTYYLTTYYDTKVGDQVVLEVLPLSRVVLRLEQ